jgi:hypothetical protein
MLDNNKWGKFRDQFLIWLDANFTPAKLWGSECRRSTLTEMAEKKLSNLYKRDSESQTDLSKEHSPGKCSIQ